MKDLMSQKPVQEKKGPGCLTDIVSTLFAGIVSIPTGLGVQYLASLNDCVYNPQIPNACVDDAQSLIMGVGAGLFAGLIAYGWAKYKLSQNATTTRQMARPKDYKNYR